MPPSDVIARPQSGWGLRDWLTWQERLHPRAIDLGLERTRTVAERLGLLPPKATTLTVAGTNGKGSSTILAATIYHAAGYRTGCFTSPHLLRYNERIAIDGIEAGDEEICAAFAAIDAARGEVSLSYFEFGTLAALWLFREAHVDVQVLEVGLGGRLDAVNVVDADCALLTSVGIDHVEWLGSDRESIGREKAGIFRAGRPAVCADPDPPATVTAVAAGLGADFRRLAVDFHCAIENGDWSWRGRERAWDALPPPGLPGAAQYRNAAGVLAAVEALQALRPVDESAIRAALPAFRLKGRLQRCGDLLLDVGHNAEAVQVLFDYLRAQSWRPRALVLGVLADKPVEAIGGILAPLSVPVFAAGLPPPRGQSGERLRERLRTAGIVAQACRDVAEALRAARAVDAMEGAPIVVCGSFLTVAAAL